jgi:carbonic anhydrase/acetyltransferase-like protein (isoleucine patch superfamily)
VWIGVGATVLDGLRIGDGAIVGAGAVVVKDIEPYAIYGGVPARLIRRRFSDDDIELLLGFRWWDRDEDWLRSHLEALHDIKLFATMSRQTMSLP